MSQKVEKPTLQGQRIKTRKRDEKEKYDPFGFRDSVLQGLQETGGDVEQIYKFLDTSGSKLDYRRYGEVLFDILIAGGILAPGGSISTDGDPNRPHYTSVCIFGQDRDKEAIKPLALVLPKLMRRFKYLERLFEDEMQKVLLFLRGFSEDQRSKLAIATAIWLASSTVPPTIFQKLLQEHLVKDGVAANFLINVMVNWKSEKDANSIKVALRSANLGNRLMEFFPSNKRTQENFHKVFADAGLAEIVDFHKDQANAKIRKQLQQTLDTQIKDGQSVKELTMLLKEAKTKHDLGDKELIGIMWGSIMGSVEWNKKEELVAEQAMKHLRTYCPLLAAFTTTAKAEMALMHRVQEYCYENIHFMKHFSKVVILFYKSDVLSEDVILMWYKDAHLSKGKSVFLEQMKKFVDWLQIAEEESEEDED